ncbi:MAG: hypothetical protein ABI210_14875, partial [Abditibacteriaceae bacterium]
GKSFLQGGATASNLHQYWNDSARCLAAVIGLPMEEVVSRVLAFHRERLDAVPDLTMYPELKGYRDRLVAQERGMNDAGVEDNLIALSQSLNFWRSTRLLQETGIAYYAQAMPEKCRILYMADSDRGALHLKNVDDPLTYWTPAPPVAPNTPWPYTHPLFFDGVGSGLHIDEIPPEIFPVDVRPLCQEHCTTVKEAEEFMVRYNYFWSGQNLLIHDNKGNSVAFEKTSCRVGVRGPNEKGINFINGMTAVDPEISAFQKQQRQKYLDQIGIQWNDSPDGRYFDFSENKMNNMIRYVKELSLNPTWDNAKQLMEQRDSSGPMCQMGERLHHDQPALEYTLQMLIFEWDNKRMHLRQWRKDVPVYLDTPEIVSFE